MKLKVHLWFSSNSILSNLAVSTAEGAPPVENLQLIFCFMEQPTTKMKLKIAKKYENTY